MLEGIGVRDFRKRSNELFSHFVTNRDKSSFVDVQGGKSTIRFYMPSIDLNLKINDGRDMLYDFLVLADRQLEKRYQENWN